MVSDSIHPWKRRLVLQILPKNPRYVPSGKVAHAMAPEPEIRTKKPQKSSTSRYFFYFLNHKIRALSLRHFAYRKIQLSQCCGVDKSCPEDEL